MTREECIKLLYDIKTDAVYKILSNEKEAIDMAIKALEQQPCEDWHGVPSDEMTLEQARQAVKDLRKMLPEYLEQNPNGDCISREDVQMALTGDITDCTIEEYIARLRDKLSKLPSVTPKGKTGKWIYTGDYITDGMLKCSSCGYEHDVADRFLYCPNCGAKMIEPQGSEVSE